MIIKIKKSIIFTQHPALRFARLYNVRYDLFYEIWRRYTILNYSIPDLSDFFYVKTGKKINNRKMNDWIFKMKIFEKVTPVMNMGVEAVKTEFFGDLEERLIKELTKEIRSGRTSTMRFLA